MTPPRRTSWLAPLALAMAAGLAAAPAPSPGPIPAPQREYIAPQKRRRKKAQYVKQADPKEDDPPAGVMYSRKARRARRAKYVGSTASQKWQRDKKGNAIDGRGDFRSAKRLLRQRWCARFELATGKKITTGRQWVRLRRALRRQVREATR